MTEKTITSKSFSRSLEGQRDFTGTLVYEQEGTYDEILEDSPNPGIHSGHFPDDCVLQTVDANSQDGNLWTVVCKFFKRAVETSKFKHGGPVERNVKIKTIENQISVLKHKRYASIQPGFRSIFEQLRSGGIHSKIDYPKHETGSFMLLGNDYVPDLDTKTKTTIGKLFEWVASGYVKKNRDLLLELYDIIAVKGIKNFPAPYYEVVETELVSNYSFSKNLGKICKPSWAKIPNLPDGGNWLLEKEEVSWKEALQKWERVRTFKSPQNGGKWNEEIFSP